MNNEDKILAILENICIEQQQANQEFKEVKQTVEQEFKEVKQTVARVEKTVVKIEQEHGMKLNALFDVCVQNTQILGRIEKDIARHEEIIMHRI